MAVPALATNEWCVCDPESLGEKVESPGLGVDRALCDSDIFREIVGDIPRTSL